MIDVTKLRFWLAATAAWVLACILLLDHWFLFSPLGIIITFCLPALGWFLWWRYAPSPGRDISPEEQEVFDRGLDLLQSLKSRFNRQP